MEWFSRLPTSIRTFDEIANMFIQKYSHNIQYPVNIQDFCNLKQNIGEPFLMFLQIWRQLYTKYSQKIPKTEKLDIFMDNLLPNFGNRIQLKGPHTFQDIITQAIQIKEFIVKKGKITLQKDIKQGFTSSKDESNYVKRNWEV